MTPPAARRFGSFGSPGHRTVAGAILAACCAVVIGSVPAVADPGLDDATAQAKALQAQVTQLQTKAEVASEQYDAAQSALGTLVVQERAAELTAQAAQQAADADRAALAQRVRALYMSGGKLSLYAGVLDGTTLSQLDSGLHDVDAIANAQSRQLRKTVGSDDSAAKAQAAVQALLTRQATLTAQASTAQAGVQAALDQQQQALDDANAKVRQLADALEAQQAAAEAAAAAQQLAAAMAAMGTDDGQPSDQARAAIAAAQTQLGKPYVYGGSGPADWDCSGLTQWAYRQAGVDLPRTAAEQWAAESNRQVPLGALLPGDLLFWATDTSDPSTIHHVAIYVGNGMMLAAPHTGTVVQIQPVYLDGYFGAVRPS